jgi:hypothetical protein
MTGPPYTGATGQVDLRYVLRSRVDEYVHASDGFLIWLAVTLAAGGASAATGVALAVGVTHPVVLYILLSIFICLCVAFGVVTVRDGLRVHRIREQLDRDTRSDLPLSITVTANAVPAINLASPPEQRQANPTAEEHDDSRGVSEGE